MCLQIDREGGVCRGIERERERERERMYVEIESVYVDRLREGVCM